MASVTSTRNTHPLLARSPYQAYVYGYPHKTAYRPFTTPIPLSQTWAQENRSSRFLYLHIPFCEMRCGFCNLFTSVDHRPGRYRRYLDALERQMRVVAEAIGPARYTRLAIGGGTPTILSAAELDRLFDLIAKYFDVDPATTAASIETSPATASQDKLQLLRDRGVKRVSIGVQSFDEEDARSIGRPMDRGVLLPALERIGALGFPAFNIDLIYGGALQTPERWSRTLDETVSFNPTEVYLYPLYVRPLTTLGKLDRHWDDQRLAAYRVGRDTLASRGYRQVSLRMFQRPSADAVPAPAYCCQQDSMLGLGCGARSYTGGLHYATEYAVGQPGVRSIIDAYLDRPDEAFAFTDYGIALDQAERARRDLIMSLLQCEGMQRDRFARRFGRDALELFPQLRELEEIGLMQASEDKLRLTPLGIERSDAIGPWLYSPESTARMEQFTWR